MNKTNYTVGGAIFWAENALEEGDFSTTPALDAEVLLSFVTGLSKEDLFFEPGRAMEEKLYHDYERLIARRKEGEPVAYIVGKKEFFGLEFNVDNSVLIPRPETEELVEKALEFIKEYDGKKLNILDMGTGSGAIAVSMASSINTWNDKYDFDSSKIKITAVDISPKALKLAKKNAKKNKHDKLIEFVESDLIENIKDIKKYGLVVANLPYLDPAKRSEYSRELSEEPYIALYAGESGLDYYLKLLVDLKKLEKKPHVILECEEYQKEALQKLYDDLECIVVDEM